MTPSTNLGAVASFGMASGYTGSYLIMQQPLDSLRSNINRFIVMAEVL
jgi:hypothetical protein